MRLRKVLVAWFGATIIAGGIAVALVSWALAPEPNAWRHTYHSLERFVGHEFERVWDDPAERAALARRAAVDLELDFELRDADGVVIERFGEQCDGHSMIAAKVLRGGHELGSVHACWHRGAHPRWPFLVALLVAGTVLWTAAGLLARRLTRPFDRLTVFAKRLADGDLDARVDLGRHRRAEATIVADALNEMAARVSKQIADGRALLAAVSHELRTPLGHLRVLVELLRDRGGDPETIADLEREIVDLDALVGKLLVDARLQFSALSLAPLSARSLGERALNHAGLPIDRLVIEGEGADAFDGDPTVLARALGNLLENAAAHGDGAVALRIRGERERIVFAVDDEGPGFSDDEQSRAFEPFVRGKGGDRPGQAALGLGLALVHRIAVAHGGDAWVEPRKPSGARVCFSVARNLSTRVRS
ncbi:MAG TPA: ATP-binding protein [Nannocystaceae bacterium]|nr:ATP-binding protein [Nannocystaceae bacterium]